MKSYKNIGKLFLASSLFAFAAAASAEDYIIVGNGDHTLKGSTAYDVYAGGTVSGDPVGTTQSAH